MGNLWEIKDLESHYDIGLAYKNMGLFADAIRELELALALPRRQVDSYRLLGQIQLEKHSFNEALALFQQGLAISDITSAQKADLFFEIGQLYEIQADFERAYNYYLQVQTLHSDYPQIDLKIEGLKKIL